MQDHGTYFSYKALLRIVLASLVISCTFAIPLYAVDNLFVADSTIYDKPPANASGNFRSFDELDDNYEEVYDPLSKPNIAVDDSIQQLRQKAADLSTEVSEGNLYITNLNELAYLKLPVGIQKQIGPLSYTIIISSIKSLASGSLLEAYCMFEIPSTGDKIAFRGTNIPFSNTKGFTGMGRLDLLGDYPVKISSSIMLSLIGNGNTYVEFDCDGFAGMSIEAGIEFSRELIIPEKEDGTLLPAPARVETSFITKIQHWNDILLRIDLPTFQVHGLRDVSFTASNAVLDWSDLMNPAGIKFPVGYISPLANSPQPTLWQGIYLKYLDIKLPKAFSKDGSRRVGIGVENMIIDDQGFSGKIFAENVLNSGDMGGWPFTIEKVSIELVNNSLKGFEIKGKLKVLALKDSVGGKSAEFEYLAHKAADGTYLFAVMVADRLKLPAFMADLNIVPGSSISVIEKENRFYPTAILNGSLSIRAAKASLTDITFEGLRISTLEPKFDIQAVGFDRSGNQKVSNFPIVINGISVERDAGKFGIGVDMVVNIGGSPEESGFGGSGKVIIWTKHEQAQNNNQSDSEISNRESQGGWAFDRIDVGAITVNAKKPGAFELSGSLNFFEGDATYGDGFKGAVTGSLGKVGPISVNALFGKTNSFRYWYADALVVLPSPISLIPGVMFANSFGGGFYYKMKQTDQRPNTSIGSMVSSDNTTVYYVPEANSFGIKAIMGIQSVRKEAMNGTVLLELMMNRHGGINAVSLSGNADFMYLSEVGASKIKELAGGAANGTLTDKLGALPRGSVNGSVRLVFDNVNDVFHGNMEVFVNVAAGIVRGVGQNSRAGWAVLHFEKNDWYIHIGTPTDPIGLEVAKIFKAKSYFMLGKNLPGSPPPPTQVTEILGNVDLDYMRDMNALQSGTGFAFGMHFIVDTGDLNFLMFYGRFAAGTGVDFMLKDYGTNYHCSGSSGPMGINGWYANGQAYAFVMGKVGIKVNLKFYKGNYDILNIGAAAVLQMKGPNPFWMKGTVGGYYSILGGMVKGQCKFDVELGEKCTPVGEQNVLADQQMIAEISPADGSTKVDVFATPQVVFNIPVGQVFNIIDSENNPHVFRASLQKFSVSSENQQVPGSIEWNSDKTVAVFNPHEVLPGERTVSVNVDLRFEELRNNTWSIVYFSGQPVEEKSVVSFLTDKAPAYIPAHNVLLSYPVQNQSNFYPDEYQQGFIQLKIGQSYLFAQNTDWRQVMSMNTNNGLTRSESSITYDVTQKKVSFSIPENLLTEKVYSIELMNLPLYREEIDSNVKEVESDLESAEKGSVILTTREIEREVDRKDAITFYEYKIRTSRYRTFGAKVETMGLAQATLEYQWIFVSFLYSRLSGPESFDAIEMIGANGRQPLVKIVADLPSTQWFINKVNPGMYDSYPYLSIFSVSRNQVDDIGIPPVNDITIGDASLQMNDDLSRPSFSTDYVSYNIMRPVSFDFYEMQQKAVNYVVDNPLSNDQRIQTLITGVPPYLRKGDYKIKFMYHPPGSAVSTSSIQRTLTNLISVFGE